MGSSGYLFFTSNAILHDSSTQFLSDASCNTADLFTAFSEDPMLDGNFSEISQDPIDPRPACPSPAYSNVDPVPDEWYVNTTFKGAFNQTNWLDGWSFLNLPTRGGFASESTCSTHLATVEPPSQPLPFPPPPPPCNLLVNGWSCSNGYSGTNINQIYLFVGHTADGRPYYQSETETPGYIFYDSNCNDGGSGWLFGCSAPSLTAAFNLQGAAADSGCCNHAQLEAETASRLPSPVGTHSFWRWCGDQENSGNIELSLTCTSATATQPSPPPPPAPVVLAPMAASASAFTTCGSLG